jgi:hypothetical protein
VPLGNIDRAVVRRERLVSFAMPHGVCEIQLVRHPVAAIFAPVGDSIRARDRALCRKVGSELPREQERLSERPAWTAPEGSEGL